MFGNGVRGARRLVGGRLGRFESLENRIALSAAPTVTNVTLGSTEWSSGFVDYLSQNGLGTGGYSIPVGSTAQSTTLPWNNLNQIRITFSENVIVDKADLALSGVLSPSYSFSNFTYSSATRTAVWTLLGNLPRDRYWIDLDANGGSKITDLEGNWLDGEWVNNSDTYATGGNGVAGGDFEFSFNVLVGDRDASGTVASADWVAANNGKTTTSSGYDFRQDINGSGVINATDQAVITANLSTVLPTGTPIGASNDAPTTVGLSYTKLLNPTANVTKSLWAAFADVETSDSQLTFAVTSNTNASLFDTMSINQSTGQLTLSSISGVSGRAFITVEATDASGQKVSTTMTVDVNRDNLDPFLDMTITEGSNAWEWIISGWVTDGDDDVSKMYVELTELITARVSVNADGSFTYTFTLDENNPWGYVWGVTTDFTEASNEMFVEAGWS